MDLMPLLVDSINIISTSSMAVFAAYVMNSMIKDKQKECEDNPFRN
jgi:hypothetical protein